MRKIKYWILMFFLLGMLCPVHSQEDVKTDTVKIYFQQGKSVYNPDFRDNQSRLANFVSRVQAFREDSAYSIHSIHIIAVASPEGSFELNQRLSHQRAENVSRHLKSCLTYGDSLVRVVPGGIDWGGLTRMVSRSDMPHKQEVMGILADASHKSNARKQSEVLNQKLRNLQGGSTWLYINRHFFTELRTSDVTIVLKAKPMKQEIVPLVAVVETPPEVQQDTKIELPEPMVTPMPTPELEPVAVPEPEEWVRQLHVKTNTLGLALAIANLAVEVDICKQLSFTLPVYYSAWDYFKSTLKFRTFCVQPEFRYWFNKHNEGWFLGAHFGFAYYNFALDGEYRTQDHSRETPSIGGGLALGYRTHLDKKKRWKMEFALGGGAYTSHYDKFHNRQDGLKVSEHKKTWYGIDQAAVTFAYTFNLDKKGGKQ